MCLLWDAYFENIFSLYRIVHRHDLCFRNRKYSSQKLSFPLVSVARRVHGRTSVSGRENTPKGPWTEIKTGRDHSPATVTGKTEVIWRKIIFIYNSSGSG